MAATKFVLPCSLVGEIKELAFLRGSTLLTLACKERDGRLVPLQETIIATVPQRTDLYSISKDGSRFLVGIAPPEPIPVHGIRVIIDGIAALSRRSQP